MNPQTPQNRPRRDEPRSEARMFGIGEGGVDMRNVVDELYQCKEESMDQLLTTYFVGQCPFLNLVIGYMNGSYSYTLDQVRVIIETLVARGADINSPGYLFLGPDQRNSRYESLLFCLFRCRHLPTKAEHNRYNEILIMLLYNFPYLERNRLVVSNLRMYWGKSYLYMIIDQALSNYMIETVGFESEEELLNFLGKILDAPNMDLDIENSDGETILQSLQENQESYVRMHHIFGGRDDIFGDDERQFPVAIYDLIREKMLQKQTYNRRSELASLYFGLEDTPEESAAKEEHSKEAIDYILESSRLFHETILDPASSSSSSSSSSSTSSSSALTGSKRPREEDEDDTSRKRSETSRSFIDKVFMFFS